MLTAGRVGGIEPDIAFGNLDFVDDGGRFGRTCPSAIAKAQQILGRHGCSVTVTPAIEDRCLKLADALELEVAQDHVSNTSLVAALNDLLNFYEHHLPPRA